MRAWRKTCQGTRLSQCANAHFPVNQALVEPGDRRYRSVPPHGRQAPIPSRSRILAMNAFLIGAGCSSGTLRYRSGCPPLAEGFGRRLSPTDYPNLAKIAQHLGNELSQLGMEPLWSCIDYYAKFKDFLPDPDRDPEKVAYEIKKAVLFLYGSNCENAARAITRSTNCTLVNLLQCRVRPGDVIISFNYDTLVERLARRFGLKLTHCVGRPPRNKIKFAKPHGSTSWRIGQLPVTMPIPPLLESLREVHVEPGKTGTEPLVLGAVPIKSELIREVQFCCGTLDVFTVIMNQWRAVVEAVRDADVVVVAGYGFPVEDQYGRFLFQEGVRQRRKPLKRVEYYNVDRKSEAAIREIFGPGTKVVWKRRVTAARPGKKRL